MHVRPRNRGGWEALVRCLFKAGMLEEAIVQNEAAIAVTQMNSLFLFYKAAILFESGDSKEALLQLEEAMESSPRLLKKFIELNPSILQNQQVVDLVAKYKRKRSIWQIHRLTVISRQLLILPYFCAARKDISFQSKSIIMNFNLSQIPERIKKPRKSGLTMVMDKGLSVE